MVVLKLDMWGMRGEGGWGVGGRDVGRGRGRGLYIYIHVQMGMAQGMYCVCVCVCVCMPTLVGVECIFGIELDSD